MYLVNSFGRVVDVEERLAERHLQAKRMRKADPEEIAAYQAHITQRLAPRPVAGENSVYYSTVKKTPDGYGMSRDHLQAELSRLKVHLSEQFDDQKVGLLYNYPYGVVSMRSDVRLIFTMFESDKLPEGWDEYLAAADEVIVPSRWCAETFKKSGIDATVVPLGYNERAFGYIDRTVPVQHGEPFTFIHYDSFNTRKGFVEVVQAFQQEFSHTENVRLILKTVQERSPVPLPKSEYPNVEIVRGSVSERDLVNLLRRSHCMVYPSRGEGFGITPLEAMATGIPAIVPNAHGISEYFDPRYMLEVEVEKKVPALYNKFKGEDVGSMVLCSVEDLRKKMRHAFKNQADMKALGKEASEYVKKFTFAHTALRLAEIIGKWQKADVIKRRDSKFLPVERV